MRALAIEFAVEDVFPGAEVQFARRDGADTSRPMMVRLRWASTLSSATSVAHYPFSSSSQSETSSPLVWVWSFARRPRGVMRKEREEPEGNASIPISCMTAKGESEIVIPSSSFPTRPMDWISSVGFHEPVADSSVYGTANQNTRFPVAEDRPNRPNPSVANDLNISPIIPTHASTQITQSAMQKATNEPAT